MSTLEQITTKIIKEQELIVGPLAWSEASKVSGIRIIDANKGEVAFNNGDQKDIVNRLVGQYDRIFGRASHEVSREAVVSLVADLAPSEVPSSLR